MSVNRRFILKSVSLSSIATLAMDSPTRALAGAVLERSQVAKPVLTLVNDSAAAPLFLQGVRSATVAGTQIQRIDHGMDYMLKLERHLRNDHPQRVIGLLDDATATLAIDLARSAGARVQWLGQHSASSGVVRHRLLAAEIADDCTPQLRYHLHTSGEDFGLYQHGHHAPMMTHQARRSSQHNGHTAQWVASLGYLLASLSARQYGPPPVLPTLISPLTGTFVSFLIDTRGV